MMRIFFSKALRPSSRSLSWLISWRTPDLAPLEVDLLLLSGQRPGHLRCASRCAASLCLSWM